ncbi:MAG: glycosyltransferase [Pseudomonadota bacterium]
MRLLHVTADYPDPLAPGKTPAVRNLLELVPEHEHRVFSLNRVGGAGIASLPFEDAAGRGHRAVAYGAPGLGVRLLGGLRRVGAYVLETARDEGFAPDAVHAHKLSTDALAAAVAACGFGVPLILSSQGNSDLKILGARPDLRPRWRRMWREAAAVLPFAPWTRDALTARLGPREGFVRCLPCPTPLDAARAPEAAGPLLRSAFHLAGHANKNAALMIRAAAAAAREVPDLRLEIAGGGDAGAYAALSRLAEASGGAARLVGPVAHGAMADWLHGAAALVLASRRESYGMVFAEALLAGTPAMHPAGAGIDGYFEDGGAVLRVDASDEAAVAAAFVRLAREEGAFKARLAALQASGGLRPLTREGIAETYRAALAQA